MEAVVPLEAVESVVGESAVKDVITGASEDAIVTTFWLEGLFVAALRGGCLGRKS